MAVLTQNVGVRVLEALGLATKNCRSLTIKFEPNDVVIATADYYPSEGGIFDMVEIVKELRPAPAGTLL